MPDLDVQALPAAFPQERAGPPARRTPLRPIDLLWVLLALLPLGFLIFTLAQNFVEALWADDWVFLELITKTFDGTFRLRDLWFQQNEHRPVFTSLFLLPLIHWSRWNSAWGQALSVALAALNFLLLARQIRRSAASLSVKRSSWFLPLLSAIIFSLSSQYVWVVMTGMPQGLVMLAGVLSLTALTAQPLSAKRVAWAAAAAIVASFSCAHGLMLWPVGLAMIAWVPLEAGRRRWHYFAAWVLVSWGVAALYGRGFVYLGHHPSFLHVFQHPWRFADYVLTYLGAPLLRHYADLGGLLGVALFLALPAWLVRGAGVPWRVLAPYLALGIYGMATAIMTGVGRAWMGAGQAVESSQYIVHGNFLRIANAALLYLLAQCAETSGAGEKTSQDRRGSRRWWFAALSAYVLAVAFSVRSLGIATIYKHHRDRLEKVRGVLLAGRKDQLPEVAGWYLPFVVKGLPSLKKHGLSIFRARREGA